MIAAGVFVVGQVSIATAQQGLSAEHFGNPNFEGDPVSTIVPTIDFAYGGGGPDGVNVDQFASRYYGEITPRYSETYTFETLSDDGVRVWIDGQLIICNWTYHGNQTDFGVMELEAGRAYTLLIEHFDGWGGSHLQAWWQSASQERELLPSAQMRVASPPEGGIPEIRLQSSDDWGLEGEMGISTGAGARLTTFRPQHWRRELTVNLRASWTGDGATLRIPEISWTDETRTEGVIVLAGNQTSKLSVMERIDDGVYTGTMSVTIELQPGDGYTIAGDPVRLTFTDDDPEPEPEGLTIGGTVTARGPLPDGLIAVGAKADPEADEWADIVYLAEAGPYALSMSTAEPHTVYAWVDANGDGVRDGDELSAETAGGDDSVRVDLLADVLDIDFYIGEGSQAPDAGVDDDAGASNVDADAPASEEDAAADAGAVDEPMLDDATAPDIAQDGDADVQGPTETMSTSDSGCSTQSEGAGTSLVWLTALALLLGARRRRSR